MTCDRDSDSYNHSDAGRGSHNERLRIFCALDMPQKVSEQANDLIRQLRSRFPDVKAGWNRDGRFHLTLKFFGELSRHEVEALSEIAAKVAANISPFRIVVQDAGAFPAHGFPRVLWLGVTDLSGNLRKLQKSLEDECSLAGFPREERPFHPHLTLARIRKRRGDKGASGKTRALAAASKEIGFSPVELEVSDLIVYRSETGETGSRYTVISRHRFQK